MEEIIIRIFSKSLRVFLDIEIYFIANMEYFGESLMLWNVCIYSPLPGKLNRESVLMTLIISLTQYWQIFYSFLIFCCYFTHLNIYRICIQHCAVTSMFQDNLPQKIRKYQKILIVFLINLVLKLKKSSK